MKKGIISFGLAILATILCVNCSDNDESAVGTIDPMIQMKRGILTDLSNNVITKTYEDLNINAVSLQTTISGLTIGNEPALLAVKEAWRATRSSWEQSESFLYGPAEGGIDPALDSWPVDTDSINAILNLPVEISADTIKRNNFTRGFHVIEYLVWGSNGQKTAGELTAKEIEYLNAAATDLQINTQTLYDGWLSTSGNFSATIISAGNNTIYPLQNDAFSAMIDGMITLANELITLKIETPLDEGVLLEESRLSNNTKSDLANNIRSIQNLYLGDFSGADSKGLTDLVAPKNTDLDAEIKDKISAAIAAIDAIPGTFTQALTADIAAIDNAQAKIFELKTVLESELKPFINSN